MKMFFNFPKGTPVDHPIRQRIRKLILVRDFQETHTPFDASYVIEFLGSVPTGVLPERRIYVIDLRYGFPSIPMQSLLVDLHTGTVPMHNMKGYCVAHVPVRQYLQEFLIKDPMADHQL